MNAAEQAISETVIDLAAKVRESTTMGRPADARDYSEALANASAALYNVSDTDD